MKIQLALIAFAALVALAYAQDERDLAVPAPVTNLDWNGDGVVDWRDDVIATEARRPGGRWTGGRPVSVRADWNRDGVIDWQDEWRPVADWNGDGIVDWRDDWVVREGRRGAWDWNGDGIIDWRDDVIVDEPVVRESSPWVRADWNRDGVIDWQDGWRQLDSDWVTGEWDPYWRGEGWRPETVSVREVPADRAYFDTDWTPVEGWDLDRDGWVEPWERREVLSGRAGRPRRVSGRSGQTAKQSTSSTTKQSGQKSTTTTKPKSSTTGTTGTNKASTSGSSSRR